jgi:hypothetical protein
LHAACVRIGSGAVALTGRTGAGKSTLAAALVRRGHALVADDVCVIDAAASNGPRVLPSFPRLKLWNDTLQALDISTDGMLRADSGKRKFHFYQRGSFELSPVKLSGVYVLNRSLMSDQQDVATESRADAAMTLSREIYRRPIGFHLGRKAALLTEALHMASVVPVFRFLVQPDLSLLDRTAARIEAHFVSLRGSA